MKQRKDLRLRPNPPYCETLDLHHSKKREKVLSVQEAREEGGKRRKKIKALLGFEARFSAFA